MVHNVLEIWQGSQNKHATQKISHTHNQHITAVGCISDTEENINASWSYFQHDRAAAFNMLKRSPVPPALSPNNLPSGQSELLRCNRILSIDYCPARSDENTAPDSICDTKHLLG